LIRWRDVLHDDVVGGGVDAVDGDADAVDGDADRGGGLDNNHLSGGFVCYNILEGIHLVGVIIGGHVVRYDDRDDGDDDVDVDVDVVVDVDDVEGGYGRYALDRSDDSPLPDGSNDYPFLCTGCSDLNHD